MLLSTASSYRHCSTEGCKGMLVPSGEIWLGWWCKSGVCLQWVQSWAPLVQLIHIHPWFSPVCHVTSCFIGILTHRAYPLWLSLHTCAWSTNFCPTPYNILWCCGRCLSVYQDDPWQGLLSCQNEMEKHNTTLRSWHRAVTAADGCWLTRGHFSQNCTFIIKNFMRSSILWYGHLCMREGDDIIDKLL